MSLGSVAGDTFPNHNHDNMETLQSTIWYFWAWMLASLSVQNVPKQQFAVGPPNYPLNGS